MTRTLLVRNKQPQHSLPDISHKQTKSVKKIRCKRATVAPYLLYSRLGSLPRPGSEEKKYGANAPQLHHILAGIVVIVRARAVEWGGGDPCGRPGVYQHPIFYNDDLDKSLAM